MSHNITIDAARPDLRVHRAQGVLLDALANASAFDHLARLFASLDGLTRLDRGRLDEVTLFAVQDGDEFQSYALAHEHSLGLPVYGPAGLEDVVRAIATQQPTAAV